MAQKIDIDVVVETFARMTHEQRDEFVKKMVQKWPYMAQSIGNCFQLEQMVQDTMEGFNAED
tara:strand:+ start:591 stop:776 length:186 start_codon:yes stop_codon:yes gene_type:complete